MKKILKKRKKEIHQYLCKYTPMAPKYHCESKRTSQYHIFCLFIYELTYMGLE